MVSGIGKIGILEKNVVVVIVVVVVVVKERFQRNWAR